MQNLQSLLSDLHPDYDPKYNVINTIRRCIMTVTTDNGRLKVILSETETSHYGIDEAFFSGDTQRVRSALKALLCSAAASAGFSPDALHFLIEIYPVFDGGCEIFFIPSGTRSQRQLKAKKCVHKPRVFVAELSNGEAVLSLCQRLFTAGLTPESLLLKYGDRFRLVITHSRKIEASAKEYATRLLTSPLEVAKTLEYGKEICRDAIERIGNALK